MPRGAGENAQPEQQQGQRQQNQTINTQANMQRHEEIEDNILINTQSRQNDHINGIEEFMPPLNNDELILPAKEKKVESIDLTTKFSVESELGEIEEQDSERMKAVKEAYENYISNKDSSNYVSVNERDNLNELISACRWYNATRWSLRSNARSRRRKVNDILESAIKERDRINRELKKVFKDETKDRARKAKEAREARFKTTEVRPGQVKLIYDSTLKKGGRRALWTPKLDNPLARKWAKFKAYTFGFFGRNLLNIAMGAVAGAAWLASYPIAAAYGKISKQSKYYKGFNIKIPKPMSPNGWYNYYAYSQRHYTSMVGRKQDRGAGMFWSYFSQSPRILLYNVWDPIKHLLTLDIDHLSGEGYIEPHKKDRLKMEEAKNDDDVFNVEDEEDELEEEPEEKVSIDPFSGQENILDDEE